MNGRELRDAALIALMVGAAATVALKIGTVRPFLVLAAALTVPGAAVLTLFDLDDLLPGVAVAVALSIAIDIVGSLALVWSQFWHPAVLGIVLGTGSIGLLVADLRRSYAAREPPPAPR